MPRQPAIPTACIPATAQIYPPGCIKKQPQPSPQTQTVQVPEPPQLGVPTAGLGPMSRALSDDSIFHPGEGRKAPRPAPHGMQTQPSGAQGAPGLLVLPQACLSVGTSRLHRAADKQGSERGRTPRGCWQQARGRSAAHKAFLSGSALRRAKERASSVPGGG